MNQKEVTCGSSHLGTSVSLDPMAEIDRQLNSMIVVCAITIVIETHIEGKLGEVP